HCEPSFRPGTPPASGTSAAASASSSSPSSAPTSWLARPCASHWALSERKGDWPQRAQGARRAQGGEGEGVFFPPSGLVRAMRICLASPVLVGRLRPPLCSALCALCALC